MADALASSPPAEPAIAPVVLAEESRVVPAAPELEQWIGLAAVVEPRVVPAVAALEQWIGQAAVAPVATDQVVGVLLPNRQLDRQVAGVANGLVVRAHQEAVAVAVAPHLAAVAAAVEENPRAPAVIGAVKAWAAADSAGAEVAEEAGAVGDAAGKRSVDED